MTAREIVSREEMWQFPRALARFPRFTIPNKDNGLLTFMIHNLLSDGITCSLKHLLNSPKKDHVIAAKLSRKRENKSFSKVFMISN